MDSFPKVPEVVGIGFVAVAALWIIWQIIKLILKSKSEDAKMLIDTVQQNAVAMEKLAKSVDENTVATKAGTETVKISQQRDDYYTKMLVEIMRASGRAPVTTVDPAPISSTPPK